MSEINYYLTLQEVTQCARLSVDTVITIVEHGIVEPEGRQPDEWRFDPGMLGTLQRATRLQRDLELEWEAIALAVRLIEEAQSLRSENLSLRRQLAQLIEADSKTISG
jgi:chaperone modulatory protein CbpM